MTRKSALEGTLEIGSHERMEHLQAQTTCIHNIYTYIILYYIIFYSIILYYIIECILIYILCINMNIMLSNPLIQNGSDIEYY